MIRLYHNNAKIVTRPCDCFLGELEIVKEDQSYFGVCHIYAVNVYWDLSRLFFSLIFSVVCGGNTHSSFKHQTEIVCVGKTAVFGNF